MASTLLLLPRPLLHFIAAILLAPSPLVQASPQPATSQLAGFNFNDLFARWDCSGTYCGYSSQLCCTGADTCYTDSNDQAQCGAGGAGATATAAAGGYWSTYYVTYTEIDTALTTQMMSTYIASVAPAAATTTGTCNYAINETPCGSACCASNQYCYAAGTCSAAAGGGSSGYYSTYTTPEATAGATGAAGIPPLRGTSSSLVLVTQTASPSTTIPFETPVATGANVTLTNTGAQNSGLSGGAIAGIVIGVLVGLFLLALLIFCCCARGLWNTFFGGRRRRRTTEVEEYERRTHHSSGGGGGRRTWYGAARPARVSRYEEKSKRDSKGKELLGVGAGLAALWAVLGLKRKREDKRRKEEDYSEYSSDYYTSASSASSDDRRTRDTRRSISRR